MTRSHLIAIATLLTLPTLTYASNVLPRTTTIGKAQSLSMSQIQQSLLQPASNKTSIVSNLQIQVGSGSTILLSGITDEVTNQVQPAYQVSSHPESAVFTYRFKQPQATEISFTYDHQFKTVTRMSVTTAGRTYQCYMGCATGGNFEYDLSTGQSVLTITGGLLFHRDANRTETALTLNGTLRGLTEQPFLSYLSLPSTTVSTLRINQESLLNLRSTTSGDGLSAWITTQDGQTISVFKENGTQKVISTINTRDSIDSFNGSRSYTPDQITVDNTSHPLKTFIHFNKVKYGYPPISEEFQERIDYQIDGRIAIYKPLRFINISNWMIGEQQRTRSISNARIALVNHNQMIITGASVTATVTNNQVQSVSYTPTNDQNIQYTCNSPVECAGATPYLSRHGYGIHFNNIGLKFSNSTAKPTQAKPVVYLHGYLHSMGR